jgi:curli biogenesis system outer membrane secretion channel CsgG
MALLRLSAETEFAAVPRRYPSLIHGFEMHKKYALAALSLLSAALLSGCATESSRAIEAPQVRAASQPAYQGVRSPIAVGQFDNRSSYMNGIFSDGVDRLGNQSKTILITHLQQTNRINVLDRSNLKELQQEADFKHSQQNIKGATYIITGDITEFGRKEVGDQQLWGILGRGKTQVAYAKVNLNVVDVNTSEVVYSAQGAGEYQLSAREIIGFGGTSSYDSTLNGKVMDLAIREAVDHLVDGINNGAWRPTK